jgi:hypothetical protein
MTPPEQKPDSPEGKANQSPFNRIFSIAGVLLTGFIVWFMVAVVIGRIAIAIFPPPNPMVRPPMIPLGPFVSFGFGLGFVFETASGKVPVGIDFNWWNLPGTVIGEVLAFLLVRSFFPRTRKS